MSKQPTRAERLAKITEDLDAVRAQLEELRDEAQEHYDNLPDSIRESSKGETLETAADSLSEALDGIETARDTLENVTFAA